MRNEELMQKWKPILEHGALPGIQDSHRAAVTATLLENTEESMRQGESLGTSGSLLSEAAPANSTADMAKYDPVLISLVRRAMPNLVAYDIAGVQPMTGPTGLIFAMRSKYEDTSGKPEAFYGEADTDYSGAGTHANALGAGSETTGTGLATADAEALGDGAGDEFAQMSFSIEKVSVTAKSRALKAEYTTELAQDLKAIHGLDAETELANMLSAELLAEINREVIRTVYSNAVAGSQGGVAVNGTFNLDVDANGRWSVEKFKGLMFQIEKEANQIAKDTRRGKGNMIVCSSDVASALQMAGVLDYTPALNSNNLNPDDTGNTFAGVLNGRFRVYIDPYAGANYMVVGYKGSSAFDAGLFYCPYVPLQMVRAVGENSFQSKLGFKTRYGMVSNPFAQGTTVGSGALTANSNVYYRRTAVSNLL
jgi:hypothetical protein